MQVTSCTVPMSSLLSPTVADASFYDSYRVRMRHTHLTALQIFAAVFAHLPPPLKVLLNIRNRLFTTFGYEAPTTAQINHLAIKDHYTVGEYIGEVWPIFSLSDTEIIAGRDNKHLDFRVSVLKVGEGENADAVISTVCKVHNFFGRCYLLVIAPIHIMSIKRLIADALRADRL